MLNLAHDNLETILAGWFNSSELSNLQITKVTGGLSGAQLWRILKGNDRFCLRQWPTVHPTAAELTAIHGLMTHVWQAGFQIVPLPQNTLTQQTFLTVAGHLWELANWLPGETIDNPSAEQRAAALEALARLHLAAASYEAPQDAPAPGLLKRLATLQNLRDGLFVQLDQAVRDTPQSELREISLAMLVDLRQVLPATLSVVEKAGSVPLPLQWCVRDVHLGNLLFTDKLVTGIVDFGAAAIDSVAGDIARLAGSLAADDPQGWQACLADYTKCRPLSAEELRAIAAFDMGGLVASAANWLRWLFVEHREFADVATTRTRLTNLAERLKSLNQRGGPHFLGLWN